MKYHIARVSKPRQASIFGDGSQLDPVLSLSFLISILEAINDLLGRKNPSSS